jgi:hypothetical protein
MKSSEYVSDKYDGKIIYIILYGKAACRRHRMTPKNSVRGKDLFSSS